MRDAGRRPGRARLMRIVERYLRLDLPRGVRVHGDPRLPSGRRPESDRAPRPRTSAPGGRSSAAERRNGCSTTRVVSSASAHAQGETRPSSRPAVSRPRARDRRREIGQCQRWRRTRRPALRAAAGSAAGQRPSARARARRGSTRRPTLAKAQHSPGRRGPPAARAPAQHRQQPDPAAQPRASAPAAQPGCRSLRSRAEPELPAARQRVLRGHGLADRRGHDRVAERQGDDDADQGDHSRTCLTTGAPGEPTRLRRSSTVATAGRSVPAAAEKC